MAVRFRAQLRYTVGSGYARWVSDQMQVRMGMAFHLREGMPGQELSHVTTDILTSGPQDGRRENVSLDVFWPDDREDLAVDTRATLEATIPWLRPDNGLERSWMDWHRCEHDHVPFALCPVPEWRWP